MNFKLATCVLSCSLILSGQSYAAPNDPVAIVNGKAITEQDFENYKIIREEQIRDAAMPSKLEVIEELIKRELVVQDAEKKGFDKTSNFIARYESIRANLLANVATQDYLKQNKVTEAGLKQRYEDEMAKLTLPSEYKTRHILLEDEAAAKAIITQLDEGKDFSELAKANSADAGSAKSGGDIGWVRRGSVVEKFADALDTMEKGAYSKAPVNTQFGWHIIIVDDKRMLQAPPFDALKDRIAELVKEEQIMAYLTGLREAAKVEIKVSDEPKPEQVPLQVIIEKPTEAAPAETEKSIQPEGEVAPAETEKSVQPEGEVAPAETEKSVQPEAAPAK